MLTSILFFTLSVGLAASQRQGGPLPQWPVAPQSQWGPPQAQWGQPQRGGPRSAPKNNSPASKYNVPMYQLTQNDYDLKKANWCRIVPYDARPGYGVACQYGTAAGISEENDSTVVNLAALSWDNPWNKNNAYLPIECKRSFPDPAEPQGEIHWLGVKVNQKMCFITEGNIEGEEQNPCFSAIPECSPDWYKNNPPQMPEYSSQSQAFQGWPSSNVPADLNLDVN